MRALGAILLGIFSSAPARATCGDAPGDAAAVADARAQVEDDCDCAAATSRREYVDCAKAVVAERVAQNLLTAECRGAVRRCAARSTCGRPGAVTCCRTRPNGATKCRITRRPESCVASGGATACVGALPSCCDAC